MDDSDGETFMHELFQDENCVECGRDESGHDAIPFLGNWFARCTT